MNNKPTVGKMKLGMGALKESYYVHALTVQPSRINYQHLPNSEDGENLHKHENFEELPQTLIGNSQSQTKWANTLGALPASNLIKYIELPRDMHEMSSNGAHP